MKTKYHCGATPYEPPTHLKKSLLVNFVSNTHVVTMFLSNLYELLLKDYLRLKENSWNYWRLMTLKYTTRDSKKLIKNDETERDPWDYWEPMRL